MNDSNSYEVRCAFCYLVKNLWLDAIPYYNVCIPNNIKIWRNLNNNREFPCYEGDTSSVDEFKDF